MMLNMNCSVDFLFIYLFIFFFIFFFWGGGLTQFIFLCKFFSFFLNVKKIKKNCQRTPEQLKNNKF